MLPVKTRLPSRNNSNRRQMDRARGFGGVRWQGSRFDSLGAELFRLGRWVQLMVVGEQWRRRKRTRSGGWDDDDRQSLRLYWNQRTIQRWDSGDIMDE